MGMYLGVGRSRGVEGVMVWEKWRGVRGGGDRGGEDSSSATLFGSPLRVVVGGPRLSKKKKRDRPRYTHFYETIVCRGQPVAVFPGCARLNAEPPCPARCTPYAPLAPPHAARLPLSQP